MPVWTTATTNTTAPAMTQWYCNQASAGSTAAATAYANQQTPCATAGQYLGSGLLGLGLTTAPTATDCYIVTPQQYFNLAQGRAVLQRELTERQQQELAARQAEAQRVAAQEVARRQAAEARSRELLLEHLTPEQRRTFETNHWFVVRGGSTKARYRINARHSYSNNIEELGERDRVVATICCHINERFSAPRFDHYLAQKLSLEYNDREFLRIANISRH